MRIWAFAVAGLFIGLNVALAQDEIAPFAFEVAATTAPPGFFYPSRALERGIKGEARACCSAGEGNGLSCRNAGPEDGHHFYHAAQHLLRNTTLTSASADSLRRQTHEVSLTVSFDFTSGRLRNGIVIIESTGYCEAAPSS